MTKQSKYLLRDYRGNLIPVSEDVYKEWYRMKRHEKYLREQANKNRVCSLEGMATRSVYGDCGIFDPANEVEAIIMKHFYEEKLKGYFEQLPEEHQLFLEYLYADGCTLKEASSRMGWHRKKGEYWRNKLLSQLREQFHNEGIDEYRV
jgi:DNA-directed RNA polymerase specialized sigma subunit